MEQPNSTTATRTNVEDVVRVVRQIIAQRELMPGEKLGTERALAELLGVSRSNLRVALAELESNHEIVRKIGRAGGIVVSDGRLERNLNTVESLTQIAKRQGWALQSIVLSAVVAPASASDMRLLRLPADRPTVYAVTRLRMLGDAPLSVETNHLPAYLFPGFLNRDLSMSFYGLFQQEYKIQPQRGLHVPAGAPTLRINRVAYDQQGRPCERATDVYDAARIRFTMHHSGFVRLSASQR